MDLREASRQTGLNERTLRRLIKEGRLEAKMVGAGPNHHWEISPEALDGFARADFPEPGPADDSSPDNARARAGQQECTNCAWLKGQIEEMHREIEQLHVLLQRSQEQFQKVLPAPQPRRWWWPWG